MPFPEQLQFRPREASASDTGVGDIFSDPLNPENESQNTIPVASQIELGLPSSEVLSSSSSLDTQQVPSDEISLSQCLVVNVFSFDPSYVASPVSHSSVEKEQAVQPGQIIPGSTEAIALRTGRREQWEQKGLVPPIAGGSPGRKNPPLDLIRQLYLEGWTRKDIACELNVSPQTISNRLAEIEQQVPTRKEAKAFIEGYFARERNRRDEKVHNRIGHEVIRLARLYPGLREEVYRELIQTRRNEDD